MAVNFLRRVDKTHFIAEDEPTADGIQVGSLWSDIPEGDLYICTSIAPVTFTLIGGGGGGAPASAEFVVMSTSGGLSDERVLTAGAGISITDNGAGSTVVIEATGEAAVSFWSALMLGGM